jgi:serine/threonine-protein kinase
VGGRPILTDLGLGRVALRLSPGQYRAPDARLDAPGDIYSLAAFLYHLVTGKRPQGPTPPPPSRLVPGLPAGLDALLTRSLAARPEARPRSMAQLATELGQLK